MAFPLGADRGYESWPHAVYPLRLGFLAYCGEVRRTRIGAVFKQALNNRRIFVWNQTYCFPPFVCPQENSSALREVARRAGGVSHPRCHSAWRTKGALRPRMVNRTHYGRVYYSQKEIWFANCKRNLVRSDSSSSFCLAFGNNIQA